MNNASELDPRLAAHLPTLEGLATLFHPHVETVLHDLETGTIAALYNNLSRRRVGDRSAIAKFVGDSTDNFPDVFTPYDKVNWDGKKFKCVSVTIRNEAGKPIGLACYNFDTSLFQQLGGYLDQFLAPAEKAQNPIEQFTENWQQRVNECVGNYLKENNLSIEVLSGEQKRAAVNRLYNHGLFNYRGAALYVSNKLGVSRATVYNYLKEES